MRHSRSVAIHGLTAEQQGSKTIYCFKCGQEILEEARYCHKCGAPTPTPQEIGVAGVAQDPPSGAELPKAVEGMQPVQRAIPGPSPWTPILRFALSTAAWFWGVSLVLIGISVLSTGGIGGALLVMIGALCIPRLLDFVRRRLPLPRWVVFVSSVFILFIVAVTSPTPESSEQTSPTASLSTPEHHNAPRTPGDAVSPPATPVSKRVWVPDPGGKKAPKDSQDSKRIAETDKRSVSGDEARRSEVERLLRELQATRIITKMDLDEAGQEYWVDGNYWDGLKYEEKRALALTCSEYSRLHSGGAVIGMMDDRTGEELAMYGPSAGFKLR